MKVKEDEDPLRVIVVDNSLEPGGTLTKKLKLVTDNIRKLDPGTVIERFCIAEHEDVLLKISLDYNRKPVPPPLIRDTFLPMLIRSHGMLWGEEGIWYLGSHNGQYMSIWLTIPQEGEWGGIKRAAGCVVTYREDAASSTMGARGVMLSQMGFTVPESCLFPFSNIVAPRSERRWMQTNHVDFAESFIEIAEFYKKKNTQK